MSVALHRRGYQRLQDLRATPKNTLVKCLQEITTLSSQQINDVITAIRGLPLLNFGCVSWRLIDGESNQADSTSASKQKWNSIDTNIPFKAGDYELLIQWDHTNCLSEKFFFHKFSRSKSVSWWIVLGDDQGDVLALKRIHSSQHETTLSFSIAPAEVSSGGSISFIIYLLSDSICGINVSFSITSNTCS